MFVCCWQLFYFIWLGNWIAWLHYLTCYLIYFTWLLKLSQLYSNVVCVKLLDLVKYLNDSCLTWRLKLLDLIFSLLELLAELFVLSLTCQVKSSNWKIKSSRDYLISTAPRTWYQVKSSQITWKSSQAVNFHSEELLISNSTAVPKIR